MGLQRIKRKKRICCKPSKVACSKGFGVPDWTLTSDLLLRRQLLYTTELLGHIHQLCIFIHFPAPRDIERSPAWRRTLYPAELQGHIRRKPAIILFFRGVPDIGRLLLAAGIRLGAVRIRRTRFRLAFLIRGNVLVRNTGDFLRKYRPIIGFSA